MSDNIRGFGHGGHGIELDSSPAGWVSDIDGGNATADVVTERIGSSLLSRKRLGPLRYEEISLTCGAAMSNPFYEWIRTGFATAPNTAVRKDGAIVLADFEESEISRLSWTHGLITELSMPALYAASKETVQMSVKFQPQATRKVIGRGGKFSFPTDVPHAKNWLGSNFRLLIDGCKVGCRWIETIEALTLRQNVSDAPTPSGVRHYNKVPIGVEIPNLVITLSDSHADEFYRWHEDFVIKGNNDASKERGGWLEYLSSDLKQTLFRLQFSGLGIFKIGNEKADAAQSPLRRARVEMYCTNISFDYAGSATFGNP